MLDADPSIESAFRTDLTEKPREACGIFGICGHPDAATLTYFGLYALQHRGQESAGIAVSSNYNIQAHKNMGLVSDVFNDRILKGLAGDCAIGHVRYSTTGSSNVMNAQPFLVRHRKKAYAVAHNGNIVNAHLLKEELEQSGSIFQTTMDTEIFLHLFVKNLGLGFEGALLETVGKLQGAFSMVMLTLTKENMSQIIPLGEMLEGIVDRFHFNRLSKVGEGVNLSLPERDEYKAFLNEYIEVAKKNSVLGFKDNMINILMHEKGQEPFGGCAGHGCGAAFNFLALLPDGEVHACRKLPSYLGNINNQSISEIYDSKLASRYRSGCFSCRGCPIRAVCGGCLAVANSYGLDIFEEKDPFCFIRFSDSRQ